MPCPDDLVGSWRLDSFRDTGADGRPVPGPLGEDPDGFLLYTADGHLAVAMMGAAVYLGYAGRWRIDDGVLHHLIVVCSRPDWVGADQIRRADLSADLDLLTIRTFPDNGRVVRWRRLERNHNAIRG
ncbi:lipocalin-like domain-containing protein [Nocardia sp. NPDC004068]|uniref:lipocalin-like domain-containing protein n=1 Tax=Nocardia sp. NPDC004068 TaxID=3364303 RepID=UPI0036C0B1BE